MPVLAFANQGILETRRILLNSIKVDGLTHLIALGTGGFGIRSFPLSAEESIYIPKKLNHPNGKEPKILRASAPINGHILHQKDISEEQFSHRISDLISKLAERMKHYEKSFSKEGWFFEPNAFSISELRRSNEYFPEKLKYIYTEENPFWKFNLAFYQIK